MGKSSATVHTHQPWNHAEILLFAPKLEEAQKPINHRKANGYHAMPNARNTERKKTRDIEI
jgi:hypothetical protein